MVRLSKLTDYGIVLLTMMARDEGTLHTARDLSSVARIPLPTVSKILRELHNSGLLVSHRGVKGGYKLVRSPQEISVAQVIAALEGPITITECNTNTAGLCSLEPHCLVTENWKLINQALRDALAGISLQDLARPLKFVSFGNGGGGARTQLPILERTQ